MSGVAAAIVGTTLITSYMSAQAQKKAAAEAAAAQTGASQAAIDEEKRQFDEQMARYDEEFGNIKELLSPYITGGGGAFNQQMALAGMAGPEAQEAQIAGIADSPIFQALTKQGEEGILAHGSATGGLRGGNIQGALARFRPAMLKNEIESKYSKLAGISGMGQQAVGMRAGFGRGPQPSGNIPTYMQNIGDAEAQRALITGQANANMYGDIGSSVILASLLSGSGGGGDGYTESRDERWHAF